MAMTNVKKGIIWFSTSTLITFVGYKTATLPVITNINIGLAMLVSLAYVAVPYLAYRLVSSAWTYFFPKKEASLDKVDNTQAKSPDLQDNLSNTLDPEPDLQPVENPDHQDNLQNGGQENLVAAPAVAQRTPLPIPQIIITPAPDEKLEEKDQQPALQVVPPQPIETPVENPQNNNATPNKDLNDNPVDTQEIVNIPVPFPVFPNFGLPSDDSEDSSPDSPGEDSEPGSPVLTRYHQHRHQLRRTEIDLLKVDHYLQGGPWGFGHRQSIPVDRLNISDHKGQSYIKKPVV